MERKRCGRCGLTKPAEAFHRWSQRDGRQPWCKACRRAYDAEYHRRTWPRRREQKREYQRRFAAWCQGMKEGKPCADCGVSQHPAAMHWDHLPGSEKRGNLSDLARRGNRAAFLAELEKCELVCANCHAVRTVQRLGA